ncbi:hypothetical protein [Aquariibacter albus]|uniref:Uncharacterized protein n=1 Tax=Aquariibacter albus TaxID=2759899 RepID=A0A839HFA4_9BURK|nr:hypothetical protein [Aquariibacter albus]MBB1160445.1 hypothetical protein [Aquariibacter albus]
MARPTVPLNPPPCRRPAARGLAFALLAAAAWPLAAQPAPEAAASDPAAPEHYLSVEKDFTSNCVIRNGVQLLIRNTHPTRTVRVWLERTLAGRPTGDRSRSELKPGAEAEPLGCSVSSDQPQAWRVVKAQFLD